MRVDDAAHVDAGPVKLTVNARFIGRLESSSLSQIPAIEVGKYDIARLGEKEPGFFLAPAANQHGLTVAARADVTGGFFEQPELGENPAREYYFFSQRSVEF
jgi:hypothetical protein